jgi:D-methionine transport system ATP-binding protein
MTEQNAEQSDAPIIAVKELVKEFPSAQGTLRVLDNISFDVARGAVFGIIGLSGAGKSTLVRCLNLLEKPTAGSVVVNGQELQQLPDKALRLARRDIGMIFQGFNLLMQRTVLGNVMFPLEIAGIPRKQAQQKAEEMLEVVGLADKAKAYPAQLSGGQRQRVAIARVLATNPKIILSDEATSALDPQTTASILHLLKELNSRFGITIIVITHEMSVIREICTDVAVLDKGHLVEQGTVEQLFRAPQTAAAKRLVLAEAEPPAEEIVKQVEEIRTGRKVRITFSRQTAFEPVLGNVILECRTPLNILYAATKAVNGRAVGEMIVQLPESQAVSDKFWDYFVRKGLNPQEVNENHG